MLPTDMINNNPPTKLKVLAFDVFLVVVDSVLVKVLKTDHYPIPQDLRDWSCRLLMFTCHSQSITIIGSAVKCELTPSIIISLIRPVPPNSRLRLPHATLLLNTIV